MKFKFFSLKKENVLLHYHFHGADTAAGTIEIILHELCHATEILLCVTCKGLKSYCCTLSRKSCLCMTLYSGTKDDLQHKIFLRQSFCKFLPTFHIYIFCPVKIYMKYSDVPSCVLKELTFPNLS